MKKCLAASLAAASVLGTTAAAHALPASVVYRNDFQSGSIGSEWSIASSPTVINGVALAARPLGIDASPADPSRRFLGQFGGDDQVSLILTGLGAGRQR